MGEDEGGYTGRSEQPFLNNSRSQGNSDVEPKHQNRGIFVQEFDRTAAEKIRGERLTEREFAERAKHIKTLRDAANEWIDSNVKGKWEPGQLRAMTDYLSREHAETVNEITKWFLDERMYEKRPVVKLMLREIGGVVPDIFIFGWRGKDNEQWNRETKIHDHADATVALTVHSGVAEETVYLIKPEEWVDRDVGQTMSYLGSKTKRYPAGKSKTYKSPPPYLHAVGGAPDVELTVTIHAYLRPSKMVAYDFRIEGDTLVELGLS